MAASFDLRRLLPDSATSPTRTEARSPPPDAAVEWLARSGFSGAALEPLAGDVGVRRYWRAHLPPGAREGRSAILVVYPRSDLEAARRFDATSRLLAGVGVRVPEILAQDLDRGWAALEDLGLRTVFELRDRSWHEVAPYFAAAARVIDRIAGLPAASVDDLSPALDADLLRRELGRTRDVFLEPLGLLADRGFADRVEQTLDALCAELGSAPAVVCHRDFMVRNLVPVITDGEPAVGVLDHQDLRLGPPWYDLASLYNDSLFPPAAVEAAGVTARAPSTPSGRVGYHRAAVQRTLKAVGTYAAFATLGDDRYLGLIAPTLRRALSHLEQVDEAAPLAAEARRQWAAATALLD